ncbi:hypothetical protein DIPPA_29343 [Diplonema papillatum]|nr:hypothetical protein DIPPA_29343 [Diplonema papillatum]
MKAQGSVVVWGRDRRRKLRRDRSSVHEEEEGDSPVDCGASASWDAAVSKRLAVALFPHDILRAILRYLGQRELSITYAVCRQWQLVLNTDVRLALELRSQPLRNQCYDEVFYVQHDAPAYNTDFCFGDPPPAAVVTEEGWKETFDGSRSLRTAIPLSS